MSVNEETARGQVEDTTTELADVNEATAANDNTSAA